MLHKFAKELSVLLTEHVALDTISIKTAGDVCSDLQDTVAKSASAIYDVIEKKACEDNVKSKPSHEQITNLVSKLATVLNRPKVQKEHLLKIAGAVITDEALSKTRREETDRAKLNKLAELQSFGREFFCKLLNEVI